MGEAKERRTGAAIRSMSGRRAQRRCARQWRCRGLRAAAPDRKLAGKILYGNLAVAPRRTDPPVHLSKGVLLYKRDLYVAEHHLSAALVGQIHDRCKGLGARRATSPRREGKLCGGGFVLDEDACRVGD